MTTIIDCSACAGEGSVCGLRCAVCEGIGRVELPGAGRHDHETVDTRLALGNECDACGAAAGAAVMCVVDGCNRIWCRTCVRNPKRTGAAP